MNSRATPCGAGVPGSHGGERPSDWVQRWSHLVPVGGTVLDLACGLGRHTRWFLQRGHPVCCVDRSPDAIQVVRATEDPTTLERLETFVADLESGPWPYPARRFDAVVVTNYLWRPLLPVIVESVAPGGVLIYETFGAGNETVGRPARPDFLLLPGELIAACAGLRVVAYEEGFLDGPPRFVQRIAAAQSSSGGAWPRQRLG